MALRLITSVLISLLAACGGGSDVGTDTVNAGGPTTVTSVSVLASTLDKVEFGSASSESAHAFSANYGPVVAKVGTIPSDPSSGPASDIVMGQFGQQARRMLPRTPNPDYYGGELSFTMAVDPNRLNYFTVKTWGADQSDSWIILNVEGLEVGWRHDYLATDEMMFQRESGWYNGAFVYRTMRLPLHLTLGKTRVVIKLRSLGTINYYGDNQNVYDKYQSRMKSPTLPLYAAYTHTGSRLDTSSEQQGTVAGGTVRATESGDLAVANWKRDSNALISNFLAAPASSLKPDDMQFLAQSYEVVWSNGYHNPRVVGQVRDALDSMVTAYAANASGYLGSFGNDSWGGYLGAAGDAARLLSGQLGADLVAQVGYGGSIGTVQRRVAWGAAIRASLDYGRLNRLTISNQAMWAAWRIYLNNRALQTIAPEQALKEREALRYLYEAAGVMPWLGNDQPGGGDTPVRGNAPYGPGWYMVTSDGTTKEDCLVGGDYGEQGSTVMRWAVATNDAALRAQALKMLRARAALRYPYIDSNGSKTYVITDAIGCRNSQEIGQHIGYLGRGFVEDLLVASLGPDVVGKDLVGYVQQAAADGQFMSRMTVWSNMMGWSEGLRLPEYYERFKTLAPTGVKLPMGNEKPDFAWADRENMVVAAKHGDERLWAALNWRGATAMNRLARVFMTTPNGAYIAEVGIDDVRFTSSGQIVRAGAAVEGYSQYAPPDQPVNANNGQSFPAAMRADLTTEPPVNRDSGRADAYTLQYGRWLVALNAHPVNSYEVRMPAGFKSAVDLASGKTYSGAVTIGPKAYVVFYLDAAVASTINAANPLPPTVVGAHNTTFLRWDATPNAANYSIERATSSSGPFVTIAQGLAATSFTDRAAIGGTTYYYRIVAHAILGDSGNRSTAVTVRVPGGTLPAPWYDVDVGAVGAVGSARYTGSGFTITASGWDISGTSDAFHAIVSPLSGDGSIVARVMSPGTTASWAKCGVMLRAKLTENSVFAGLFITPSNGVQFLTRANDGSWVSIGGAVAGIKAPYWLRLDRAGSNFDALVSVDGSMWTPIGNATVTKMPDVAFAAVAADSNKDPTLNTCQVESVSVPALP